MWKKGNPKDKIVVILALFAVIGMIGFLFFVQHVQLEEQRSLAELGEEMLEENQSALETEKTKASIELSGISQKAVYLYNGGTTNFSLEGFEIRLDGEVVYQFQVGDQIRPGEEIECPIDFFSALTGGTVVGLYSEENELQQQTVYSLLSASRGDFYFTVPSGFYSEGVEVEIIAPEGAAVYYTLDGSEPTSESERYEEAVKIDIQSKTAPYYAAKEGISITGKYVPSAVDKVSVLRAVYVDENGEKSDSIRAEYFIAFDIKAAYSGLPVLSLYADEEGLFDYYSGIYVSGQEYENAIAQGSREQKKANYYMGWSIPAYVQYYEADRGITYAAAVMLGVEDNNHADGAQKGLRIVGNNEIVSKQSSLCYFMGEESRSLILENGQADAALKLRSMLGASMLSDTEILVPRVQPCIVFLNGEYWGLYLLTLPLDEYHIAQTYGLNETDVVVCRSGASEESGGRILYEEMVRFIAEHDMAVDENYILAEQMLDIQNYLEYVCANIYIGNSDWPNENVYAWRSVGTGGDGVQDGRWRFIWNDAEQSMGNSALSNYSLNTYLRPMIAQDQMLYSLLRNDEFCRKYFDTMQRMAESVFEEQRVNETIDEITSLCGRAVVASYERFLGNYTQSAYNAGIEVCRNFFAERSDYILNYTNEFLEIERVFSPKEEEVQQNVLD